MTSDPANTPLPAAPEPRPGAGSASGSGPSAGSPSLAEDLALRQSFIGYITATLSEAEAESFELRLLEDDEFAGVSTLSSRTCWRSMPRARLPRAWLPLCRMLPRGAPSKDGSGPGSKPLRLAANMCA